MNADVRTYTIAGMTCGHCVLSVREEVGELAGVLAVEVDLASGRMDVAAAGVTHEQIRAAVAQAGYEVVA